MKNLEKLDKPLVSFVVPTFNSQENISTCLESIRRQNYPRKEILVIDGNSDDKTLDIVEEDYSEFNIIKLGEDQGACKSLNIGFKASSGKYVITLDDDAEILDPSATRKLVNKFEESEREVALINPQIVEPPGKAFARSGEITRFHGAGVIFSSKALKETGYYDPRFFIYGNEIDLIAKIWESGYTAIGFPDVKIFHHNTSKIFDREWDKKDAFYVTRNLLWVSWKYLGIKNIIRTNTFGLFEKLRKARKSSVTPYFFIGLLSAFKGLKHCLTRRNYNAKLDSVYSTEG